MGKLTVEGLIMYLNQFPADAPVYGQGDVAFFQLPTADDLGHGLHDLHRLIYLDNEGRLIIPSRDD